MYFERNYNSGNCSVIAGRLLNFQGFIEAPMHAVTTVSIRVSINLRATQKTLQFRFPFFVWRYMKLRAGRYGGPLSLAVYQNSVLD